MFKIQYILLNVIILTCIWNNKALTKESLKVKCKTEHLTSRVSYVMEQVRRACEELSVNATIKVSIQDTDSADKLKQELQVPMFEYVAHANERGGLDSVFEDIADISDTNIILPKLNVHAFEYDRGRQIIEMIGIGSYVILGGCSSRYKA